MRLDTLVADTSVRPFNGVVVVSQGDATLYRTALGIANIETGERLEVSDAFRI